MDKMKTTAARVEEIGAELQREMEEIKDRTATFDSELPKIVEEKVEAKIFEIALRMKLRKARKTVKEMSDEELIEMEEELENFEPDEKVIENAIEEVINELGAELKTALEVDLFSNFYYQAFYLPRKIQEQTKQIENDRSEALEAMMLNEQDFSIVLNKAKEVLAVNPATANRFNVGAFESAMRIGVMIISDVKEFEWLTREQ